MNDYPIFQNDFFKDHKGQVVVWQTPNLPLIVGLIAYVLQRLLPYGQLNFLVSLVSFGALFTWAWLEIFVGLSPFRRCLGGAVMTWLLLSRIY